MEIGLKLPTTPVNPRKQLLEDSITYLTTLEVIGGSTTSLAGTTTYLAVNKVVLDDMMLDQLTIF